MERRLRVEGGVGWFAARRGLCAALVHQARELERSNEDLEQFATAVSHDLREPLRKIAGYADLLSDRYRERLDEKATRCLDLMKQYPEPRVEELPEYDALVFGCPTAVQSPSRGLTKTRKTLERPSEL